MGGIEQVRPGQVSRILDNRWTLCSTAWKGQLSTGGLARRWVDGLDEYRIVQDTQMWKQHAAAFVQPRDTTELYYI